MIQEVTDFLVFYFFLGPLYWTMESSVIEGGECELTEMGKDLERTVILVKEKRNQLQASNRATSKNSTDEGRTHTLAIEQINRIPSFLRALQRERGKWAVLLIHSWRWAQHGGQKNKGAGELWILLTH